MSNTGFAQRLFALTTLGVISIGSLIAVAADIPEAPETSPIDFTGKIILLLVDRSNALEQKNDSEVIENARMANIGGRIFVIGTAYPNPHELNDWRKGAEVGVAWEEVTSFYIFSKEQFQNYAKASESE
ncbi:MAG: hypothetical protein AB7G28_14560 [Pirellulales bacterium]